jgi:diguanylate cyclase (GGDEF)-like protein
MARALRWIGFALVGLGLGALAGWVLHVPALVRVMPHYATLAPMSALAFMALGAALALPEHLSWHVRARTWIGVGLMVLPGLILLQDLFRIDLYLDVPFRADWLEEPRPYPTRMAPNSAVAFMLGGAALVLIHHGRGALAIYLAEALALGVAIIGATALVGYTLGLDFLFSWYPYARMAVHTAAGLAAGGIGLWLASRHHPRFQALFAAREDSRILFVGSITLVLIALAASIGSFALLERHTDATLRRGLELLLANRIAIFRTSLDEGALATDAIATRAAIGRELGRLRQAPDDPQARAFLNQAVTSFVKLGFSGVAMYDGRGRRVVTAGRFARASARVPVQRPAHTTLLWDNGLYMQVRLVMTDASGRLGTVVAERPLALIDRLFQDIRGLGESGEMLVCAPAGEVSRCLPTRLDPRAFDVPRRLQGKLLPVTLAVDGHTGVVTSLDHRGRFVIAAHGPIPLTGLGMVLEMDAEELYLPLQQRFQQLLVLFAVLLLSGMALLRWQLLPLARRLIESQEAVRELSLRDELTGLRNRRGFFALAEAALALARRLGRGMFICYADLDDLKGINDTLGHVEGDRALADFAAILRRSFRSSDVLARLGGDEFAVLAMEAGSDGAEPLLARVEAGLAAHNANAGRPFKLSASIGAVRFDPASAVTLDELMAQADAAMYRVKEGRRAVRRSSR